MHTLSAIEIRDRFLRGEITAKAIAQHFLTRIETFDPQIGAFLCVLKERVIKQAEWLDNKKATGQKLGKLAAIPIAIKDNIHIDGEITTCASKFLTNFKAPFSSTAVHLLEQEDALLIGKTNLDEFAMGSSTENSALQKTFNPWNLKCIPGGSSGGSAAAVAGRLCPIALGSDTGGSIRQPASLCGVVGFKPTYGRVSRYGLVAYGSSLDQIGPIATTTADTALIMEVIGQHCLKDSTSLPMQAEDYLGKFDGQLKGKKIGVPRQFLEGLADEPQKIFDNSLAVFKSLGAEIVDVDLSLLKYSLAVYYILATAEASTNLARFDGIRYGHRSPKAQTLDEVYELSKEEGFGSEVKRRILLGTYVLSAGFQDAYYRKAQKVRALMIQKFKEAFQKCDLVATPVCPCAAFEIGAIKTPLEMYLEDIYTISSNLAGVPAISIPSGFTQDRKPLGLQIIGPQKQDVAVLHAANAFERVTDYHRSIPEFVK
ncbi:MAG: Asp-tRNA(Asn)/Glu-tRNA(Gln) amidotransferase GatCAB subunit A [Parachlamydia sp.]|nr:MAG: Asp-tRNA(Asn)/Glu-tRNA(Gln) amidotransferase GatCAB subunit A [Parachlamydia sp.]